MDGTCRGRRKEGLKLASAIAGTFAGRFCDDIHIGHMQLRGLWETFGGETLLITLRGLRTIFSRARQVYEQNYGG